MLNPSDVTGVIDTYYRSIDTVLNTATTLSTILANILDPICSDHSKREEACEVLDGKKKEAVNLNDYILLESLKRGRTYYETFKNHEEAKNFLNSLKDYGVPHLGIYHENKYLVLVDKKDKELFEKLYRKEQITKKLEGKDCSLSLADLKIHAKENLLKVTQLDEVTLKRFVQNCNEKHIGYSYSGPNNGTYTLYYAKKDKDILDTIKSKVAMQEISPAFALLQAKQEVNEKTSRHQLRELLSNQQKEPMVICDLEDKVRIRVEKRFIVLENANNSQFKIKREELDRQGKDKIINHYLKLKYPVTLKKSEYDEMKTRRNYVDPAVYFVTKQQAQGYKPIVKEEVALIAKDMALISAALHEPIVSVETIKDIYPINNEDYTNLIAQSLHCFNDIHENPGIYTKETLKLKQQAREKIEDYSYNTKTPDISDTISEVLDGVTYEMREEKVKEMDKDFDIEKDIEEDIEEDL